MLDTKGPEYRIRTFENHKVTLKDGDTFTFTTDEVEGNNERVSVSYKNLINELVNRDIKKKYRRSILGILWSMLNPLLMMLITAMVFSNLFRFEIKNFALYLLTGQIIFTFYAEATNFAMGSILENGHLIKKVYVPKYLFPLSRVASSAVNLLFTLPAMFAIIFVTGQTISFKIVFCIIP